MKDCKKCGVVQSPDAFHKRTAAKDGLDPYCKQCQKILKAADYLKKREAVLARAADYRDKNREKIRSWKQQYLSENRERLNEYAREYRQANLAKIRDQEKENYYRSHDRARAGRKEAYQRNRDSVLQAQKESYKANPTPRRNRARRWRLANPEKVRANKSTYKFRRRCRIASGQCDLTVHQWEAIKAAYRQRCAYCGKRKPLTQDHVVPVSKGGNHTAANIVPACSSCNSQKHAKLPLVTYQPHLISAEY